MKDIYGILKKYFGYDSFRPGQEKIITSVLGGRDVFAVMPTGAGKSVCYQIPALAMEGITLVISPLISLMQDQVRNLKAMGVRGAYLNSSLTPSQIVLATKNAKKGMYKIIYVAPERLNTPAFLDFAMNSDISMIAIDEAHCISQWGQDFRPAYLRISEFIAMFEKRPVVAAFTATATKKVKDDIVNKSGLVHPVIYTGGFDRPNLSFAAEEPIDRLVYVRNYLAAHKNQSGIIYCLTRQETENAAAVLSSCGFGVSAYHAGMTDEDRRRVQEDFIYGRVNIITATSAFGMGIDKPDVRFVIHLNMPARMEDYYQQAGRAGRDGERAECILLYSPADVRINRFMIEQIPDNDPMTPEERQEYIRSELDCLQQMIFYSTSKHTCLRKRILVYFGENAPSHCNNCSVCRRNVITVKPAEDVRNYDRALYSKLKAHCRKLSLFGGVPLYTIASESMLRDMASLKPKTTAQLRLISGFGEEKIKRYGKDFINIINSF